MSRKQIAQAIRETTFAEPGCGKRPRMRSASGRACSIGAIGQALRSLHDVTAPESLPPDFEALLAALDTADRHAGA